MNDNQRPRTLVIHDTWSGAAMQCIILLIAMTFAFVVLYVADARAEVMYQGNGWRATAAVCETTTNACRIYSSPLYSSEFACVSAAVRAQADLSRRFPQYRVIATCHVSTREFGA